ncbi:MAG: hypothetical protein JXJ04_21920 [Spirochaetales bacterium]|nr:hypothetical protein [Spirochaetales bacterium]
MELGRAGYCCPAPYPFPLRLGVFMLNQKNQHKDAKENKNKLKSSAHQVDSDLNTKYIWRLS